MIPTNSGFVPFPVDIPISQGLQTEGQSDAVFFIYVRNPKIAGDGNNLRFDNESGFGRYILDIKTRLETYATSRVLHLDNDISPEEIHQAVQSATPGSVVSLEKIPWHFQRRVLNHSKHIPPEKLEQDLQALFPGHNHNVTVEGTSWKFRREWPREFANFITVLKIGGGDGENNSVGESVNAGLRGGWLPYWSNEPDICQQCCCCCYFQ